MSLSEWASIIVGVATASGVTYSIIHGVKKEKIARISQEKHDDLQLVKLTLDFENKLFDIVTRWRNSKKEISDAMRYTTGYLRVLDMLAYLQKNKKMNDLMMGCFERDFHVGQEFFNWLLSVENTEKDSFQYFHWWVKEKNLTHINWKVLEDELIELKKKHTKNQ